MVFYGGPIAEAQSIRGEGRGNEARSEGRLYCIAGDAGGESLRELHGYLKSRSIMGIMRTATRFCTEGAHGIASCARLVSAVARPVGAVDRRGGCCHLADVPGGALGTARRNC